MSLPSPPWTEDGLNAGEERGIALFMIDFRKREKGGGERRGRPHCAGNYARGNEKKKGKGDTKCPLQYGKGPYTRMEGGKKKKENWGGREESFAHRDSVPSQKKKIKLGEEGGGKENWPFPAQIPGRYLRGKVKKGEEGGNGKRERSRPRSLFLPQKERKGGEGKSRDPLMGTKGEKKRSKFVGKGKKKKKKEKRGGRVGTSNTRCRHHSDRSEEKREKFKRKKKGKEKRGMSTFNRHHSSYRTSKKKKKKKKEKRSKEEKKKGEHRPSNCAQYLRCGGNQIKKREGGKNSKKRKRTLITGLSPFNSCIEKRGRKRGQRKKERKRGGRTRTVPLPVTRRHSL